MDFFLFLSAILGLIMRLVRPIWQNWRLSLAAIGLAIVLVLGAGLSAPEFGQGAGLATLSLAGGALLPDLARALSGWLRNPKRIFWILIGGIAIYVTYNPEILNQLAGIIIPIVILYLAIRVIIRPFFHQRKK